MFSDTAYKRKSCFTVGKWALKLDYKWYNYNLQNKNLEIENTEQKGDVLSVKY